MDKYIVQKNSQINQWGSHFDRRNNPYYQVWNKTERLSAAIYLLTGHISDIDPLKTELREKTIVLLKETLQLGKVLQADFQHKIGEVISLVNHLITLLEVGMIAQVFSVGNYAILKKEFEDLALYFGSIIKEGSREEVTFDHTFLGKPIEQEKDQKKYGGNFFKSEKDSNFMRDGSSDKASIDKGQFNMEKKDKFDGTDTLRFVSNSTKEGRRAIILHALSGKENLGIKDFSELIQNCSEKTIQRELSSLVLEGVLKRQGRRRWSRYSLAAPVISTTENSSRLDS